MILFKMPWYVALSFVVVWVLICLMVWTCVK